MTLYIILLITSGVIAFVLGFQFGRRKNSADMIYAVKAIAKLNTTIEIYKNAYEEQINYLSKKYTDLKTDVIILKKENEILKKKIK